MEKYFTLFPNCRDLLSLHVGKRKLDLRLHSWILEVWTCKSTHGFSPTSHFILLCKVYLQAAVYCRHEKRITWLCFQEGGGQDVPKILQKCYGGRFSGRMHWRYAGYWWLNSPHSSLA